jgi:hypothetical protein
MNEQEIREIIAKSRDNKLQPIVTKVTELLVDAWQEGFELGLRIGSELNKNKP